MQHFVALVDRKQIDPLPLDALKVYTFSSSIAEGSFFRTKGWEPPRMTMSMSNNRDNYTRTEKRENCWVSTFLFNFSTSHLFSSQTLSTE